MQGWALGLCMPQYFSICYDLIAFVTNEQKIIKNFKFQSHKLWVDERILASRTQLLLLTFIVPSVDAVGAKQFFTLTAPLRLSDNFRANHAQPVPVEVATLESVLRYELPGEVRVSVTLALTSCLDYLTDTPYWEIVRDIILVFFHHF